MNCISSQRSIEHLANTEGTVIILHGTNASVIANKIKQHGNNHVEIMNFESKYQPTSKVPFSSPSIILRNYMFAKEAASLATVQGVLPVLVIPSDINRFSLTEISKLLQSYNTNVKSIQVYTPLNYMLKHSTPENLAKYLAHLGFNYKGQTQKSERSLFWVGHKDVQRAVDKVLKLSNPIETPQWETLLWALLVQIIPKDAKDGRWIEAIHQHDFNLNSSDSNMSFEYLSTLLKDKSKSMVFAQETPTDGFPFIFKKMPNYIQELVIKRNDKHLDLQQQKPLKGTNTFYVEPSRRWLKNPVTFKIHWKNNPSSWDTTGLHKLIEINLERAFNKWSVLTDFVFERVDELDPNPDVLVLVNRKSLEGDLESHATTLYYPQHHALITLEANDFTDKTISTASLHEIGHVVGLRHSTSDSALMYPCINPESSRDIDLDAVCGTHELYGTPGTCAALEVGETKMWTRNGYVTFPTERCLCDSMHDATPIETCGE